LASIMSSNSFNVMCAMVVIEHSLMLFKCSSDIVSHLGLTGIRDKNAGMAAAIIALDLKLRSHRLDSIFDLI